MWWLPALVDGAVVFVFALLLTGAGHACFLAALLLSTRRFVLLRRLHLNALYCIGTPIVALQHARATVHLGRRAAPPPGEGDNLERDVVRRVAADGVRPPRGALQGKPRGEKRRREKRSETSVDVLMSRVTDRLPGGVSFFVSRHYVQVFCVVPVRWPNLFYSF